MIFDKIKLTDAFVIELEKQEDGRGFFARSWDQKIFQEHGLNPKLVQCNISFNKKKGTLRGLHYQSTPFQEAKLIRCTKGRIFDVIVDLRPNSGTFKQWYGIELNEHNCKMIFAPEGFAHGFLTLEDNCEVFYQMSEYYVPECAKGVRWNDKTFDIQWPETPKILSERDSNYSDFQ